MDWSTKMMTKLWQKITSGEHIYAVMRMFAAFFFVGGFFNHVHWAVAGIIFLLTIGDNDDEK